MVHRLIHAFRFEEAEQAPVQMPPGFYRIIATDKGFPPYGSMQLSNEHAASGKWSFEFALDTGSLAARVPTSVIPVLPLADYTITAQVRTEALEASRARVVAWFNDAAGNAIPGSRVETAPLATGGAWQDVTLIMVGQHRDAVDLSIELQLVQPRHFRTMLDESEPKIEDVKGRAWFDDIAVWQVPRIELSTSSTCNVIPGREGAALAVLVRDLTSESLTGYLEIEDFDRHVVLRTDIPAANDPRPINVDLSRLPLGWYKARFDLRRRGEMLTQRQLEFIIAPPGRQRDMRRGTRFAVELRPGDVSVNSAFTTQLLVGLAADSTCVPIWTKTLSPETNKEWARHLRTFVDGLLTRNIDATFVMPVVPDALARVAQVDATQVLALLRKDPSLWRPYLDDIIINFGLQISRWQPGGRSADEFGWRTEPGRAVTEVSDALGKLIAGPRIFLAWPAIEELPSDFAPSGLAIEFPYQLPPESLLEYAESWRSRGAETSIALEPLPRDAFLPRQRLADFAQRVLYGWRAQFDELVVPAPWQVEGSLRPIVEPDATFLAFQRLADELSHMTFLTELELMDDVSAWLLNDTRTNRGVIVAWSRQANADSLTLRTLLADSAVTTRDLFGNEQRIPLAPAEGIVHPVHSIPLTELPTFIDGVSLGLAQFRANFALLPNFLEAEHRVHEHQLVMTNPWEFTITGTLHIQPPEGWRLTPRLHEFTLAPGQQLNLPIDVVFDRSVLGGHKQLLVDARLLADREYEFTHSIDLEVGLREIEFSALWSLVPNDVTGEVDLIISQYVTNRGERPLNLTTYVTAPGLSQRRRMIGGLEPGQTIVRHFRIERGAQILAGKTVHVGIAEQDGSARLRKALDIPAQSGRAVTANAE